MSNSLIDENFYFIIFVFIFIINNNTNSQNWLFVLLFIINDLVSIMSINCVFSLNLNKTLTNGLFFIHPLLTYFIYTTIIVILNVKLKSNNLFFKNLNFKFLKNRLLDLSLTLSITIIVAISLGSLWAYQELGWGGWWSWDNVEMINFIILLLIILCVHSNKSYFIDKLNVSSIFSVLLIFNLSIKYDLTNSVHNFINSDKLLLTSLLIIIIITIMMINMKIINVSRFTNLLTFIIFIFIIIIVIIIINCITEAIQLDSVNMYKNAWNINTSLLLCLLAISLINIINFKIMILALFTLKFIYLLVCLLFFNVMKFKNLLLHIIIIIIICNKRFLNLEFTDLLSYFLNLEFTDFLSINEFFYLKYYFQKSYLLNNFFENSILNGFDVINYYYLNYDNNFYKLINYNYIIIGYLHYIVYLILFYWNKIIVKNKYKKWFI